MDRNGRGRDTEVAQEAVEHLVGHGRRTRVVAVQVDIQLAIRELLAEAVRPVQGQGSLADPSRAGDDHDRGSRGLLGVTSQGTSEVSQLGVPVDETPDVARQLRRRHRERGFGPRSWAMEVHTTVHITGLHDVARGAGRRQAIAVPHRAVLVGGLVRGHHCVPIKGNEGYGRGGGRTATCSLKNGSNGWPISYRSWMNRWQRTTRSRSTNRRADSRTPSSS